MRLPFSISESLKTTVAIRVLGWTKIPLLALCSPRVVEMTTEKVSILIPLRRMTKNHWGSMYFGALAVGADVAGGILAWKAIEGRSINLLFKDFSAEFHKRPTEDVTFVCQDGKAISDLVEKAESSNERQNLKVKVEAFAQVGEKVATFFLTLSLKKKGSVKL